MSGSSALVAVNALLLKRTRLEGIGLAGASERQLAPIRRSLGMVHHAHEPPGRTA
jgi:hypothetical protein